MKRATDVRSWPVGGGICPGFATKTKRVTAPSLSPILSAMTVRPKCSAAALDAIAASHSPRDKDCAAAAVYAVATSSACG
jgi:hypothetical protein